MRSFVRSIVFCCLGFVSVGAVAQQSARPAESYTYATYYVCDLNQQDVADRLNAEDYGPLYDAAVESGQITSWGWLEHHTGGPWRRAFYFTADSIDALLAAQASLAEQEDPRVDERFNEACGSHDDYIWQSIAASGADTSDGDLRISTYYECDVARETRANEIFDAVLAPLYEAQARAGRIRSWGWNEHVVGGAYRRFGSVTGDDWPSILEAIDAVVDGALGSELGRELWEICNSHSDYMWINQRGSE